MSLCVMLVESACYIYFTIATAITFWEMGLFDGKTSVLDTIFYIGLHIMQVTMTGKCVTLFAIVQYIYHHLNRKVENDETSAELIWKIRTLYHEIYNLVLELNDVIAFQLVVPFCVTFVMIVFHIYFQLVIPLNSSTVFFWLSAIINMFYLQLLHQEIKVSGAKLFDVNISLVAQFFGKGLQYLLILYQAKG
ncbi:hypothetical protein BDFB_001560 [Asbolus verrucosus]|uniref:Uncharacterized protein n=1 Tax=Asbolus verrucosus TaxID=1661398 RepID=A0A482W788_ASBVE|nr:hypothetical protein BDFB_001560 [Asbolus verrucosus]